MKDQNSDTLHLVLKHQWYDMIDSGEKKEEYRDYKWLNRIINQESPDGFLGVDDNDNLVVFGELMPRHKFVTFHRGYTSTTMSFEIVGVDYGKGRPEWGAPEDKDVIIIILGKRMKRDVNQKKK
ncbi:MAG: hypothetical protein PUF37_00880 [Prevotellaceae bacterium]|nr:hypothetical protein [Prevotellaceae bacterium]